VRQACLLAVLVAVAVVIGVPQATARGNGADGRTPAAAGAVLTSAARARSVRFIRHHRDATWTWQRVMGRPRTPYLGDAESSQSPLLHERLRELWRGRSKRSYRRAANPPRLQEWLCIHGYEGPWDANTGNGYYGGLQMDLEFQRTYAPGLLRRKGTANNWTPLEQIWVAERAYRSGRGFFPWPNTARFCELI